MKRHIAIIDPAVNLAETDCFNQLALQSPLPLSYHLPKLAGMDSLNNLSGEIAAIVILGSASSVNDGHPWQLAMNSWLLPRLRSGIPALGLCYGHQLIAHLFGGKVDFLFADRHKHLGFRKVNLSSHSLWDHTNNEALLAVSHKEAVLTCPPDFEIVGSSPEVAIDAIAHKTLPIWGFQSHPESTVSFLHSQGIREADPENKLQDGKRIVANFLRRVANKG